jgi:hypothetical protein
MAQWLKHSPCKHESLDSPSLCKRWWEWWPACNSSLKGRDWGSPKQAVGETLLSAGSRFDGETLTQRRWLKTDEGNFSISILGLYIHRYIYAHAALPVCTHTQAIIYSHMHLNVPMYIKKKKKEMRYKAIKTKKWRDIKSIK